jgi:CheY-like chemotaxis protein
LGVPHEEELERIKAAAAGGAQIVRELMIFGGTRSPEFEPVDCSLLVREMTHVLKVSISKHVALKTDLAEVLTPVNGSPAQIRQLIMNLVLNASQAIGDHSGEIRITTAVVKADQSTPALISSDLSEREYVQLEVADTGMGMTEETKAKMFDPFFTTKPGGRGLGLAVVRGVVSAHGGLINVMSSPGAGTTIKVMLPYTAKGDVATDDGQKLKSRIAHDECPAMPGTVLVIEDENLLRLAVSKMLRKKGWTVIEAGDGDAGVDLFSTNRTPIDVVLLDMTLPGKMGRAVLEELQQIEPEVKVILTSAYRQQHVQNVLGGLRPWGYVQKPYNLAEIEKVLHKCFAETKFRRNSGHVSRSPG